MSADILTGRGGCDKKKPCPVFDDDSKATKGVGLYDAHNEIKGRWFKNVKDARRHIQGALPCMCGASLHFSFSTR